MERLIVTMTSWKKRICNLPKVLDSILTQTKKPDLIVINLSIEEFPNKEKDLNIIKKYFDKIEINWIDGINTKQWKKIIPTMLKYPEDWVICIDDDQIYKNNFIATLWDKHLEYPNNPITINNSYKIKGYLQHCGHGTLECAKFYNYFKNINFDELYDKSSSDTFFTYIANKNNNHLIFCGKSLLSKTFNEILPLSKTEQTKNIKKHNDMWLFLNNKYGKIDNNNINKTTKKKESINNIIGTMFYGFY